MEFKLCILAAGRGTRVSTHKGLHKALLPLGNRAAISRILEQFPDCSVVIAVGHLESQVRNFIEFIHPDRDVEFVSVSNFCGPGSGPGHSLLCCKDSLRCPFVFTSADTIVESLYPIQPTHNWSGVCQKAGDGKYARVSGNAVSYSESGPAFVGMAGVKDYENFWAALEADPLDSAGEKQVVGALSSIRPACKSFGIWLDTGNDASYAEARRYFNEAVEAKTDEAVFIDGGRVVKFFADKDKAERRVFRSTMMDVFPQVRRLDDRLYGYDYVDGACLSDVRDDRVQDEFFAVVKRELSLMHEPPQFRDDCRAMHVDKFIGRAKRMSRLEHVTRINGVAVPPMDDLIRSIDFEEVIAKAVPAKFHGDLQPENVIYGSGGITLIDWRDSFGNSLTHGDIYYDLGKLWHASVVNGKIIRGKEYAVHVEGNSAIVSIRYRSELITLLHKLKQFCGDNGYDWGHVVLLGIMQFIGISPLHEEPYSDFLYLYGKLALSKKLQGTFELE